MELLLKSAEAVKSAGFIKAFLYSSASAVLGVAIVFLAKPEASSAFGSWAILIPLVNSVLVFGKQLFDAYRNGA